LTWELAFDEAAVEALGKLPKDVRERIFRKLVASKEDPFRYFKRLAGRPDCSLRVGDWRVIADLDAGAERIEVTLIGHRRNVYEQG
jgi:mRNA interferase RelE/StbE